MPGAPNLFRYSQQ
jgi:hypothetical protein